MVDVVYDYDVIIIGGRPAGATLAGWLGKRGLRILLLERGTFPSLPAVSSPIIYAPTMRLLDEIGAREEDYARATPRLSRMVQALREDLQFAIPIPDYKGRDYAYAVDRARFDAALWDAAVRFPGVTGQQGFNVSDLLIDADGRVTGVTGTDAERVARRYTAPLVVGADGRYSLVARKMNAAEHDVHEEAPTTIYYAYWRGLAPHDDHGPLAISYAGSRPGVGYLVMDSADATAAVVVEGRSDLMDDAGGDARAFYLNLLAEAPLLARRLEHAELVTSVRGMKRIGNLYRQAGGPGWALVGDAYHQKDPLDGQGIYNAVFGAKALAAAIIRWRAGEFADWQAALDWYDETVRIKTYSMYRALLARVQSSLYAPPPPDWLMNSALKWILDDSQLKDLLGKLMTRQIPTDAANLMTAPVMVGALMRGGLREMRQRVTQSLPRPPAAVQGVKPMIAMLRLLGGALAALVIGALLTACGAASPAPTATRTASPTPTGTPTPAPTLTAVPATEAAAPFVIAPEIAALMRSAPSPEDADFMPDSARLVGATGRPQLIEVFSYD